jgi:hypothetical protein
MQGLFDMFLSVFYVKKVRSLSIEIPKDCFPKNLLIKQDEQGKYYWVYRAFSSDESYPSESEALVAFWDYALDDLDILALRKTGYIYGTTYPPIHTSNNHD